MMAKIRVLVVDDSALLRKIISDILNRDPAITVVGTAANGLLAVARARELNPDVITMDVDMPVMDGYTALKQIMAETPRPVIMLSGLTQAGAQLTFKCLEAGAVDYLPKPVVKGPHGLEEMAAEITARVKVIHEQGTRRRAVPRPRMPPAGMPVSAGMDRLASGTLAERVVAIGISTGGPAALAEIFPAFPAQFPPVLVVQHMPKEFTGPFAERLNRGSRLTVKEAADGDLLQPGYAYIAPGDRHLTVVRIGATVRVQLKQTDKVDGHRPSATVMFKSLAPVYGRRAVGVIMTGMGRDGVDGLKELRAQGAPVVGQDQESCVVYGMPGIAAREGVVNHVVPLTGIVPKIASLLQ
ncbi:MAG TPA: chemotaxis response regulator protein-glutamate methylesterase [bacterium]|nr:chemotaxis response regulator protein-glutamate methylesterase [bacterium]